MLINPRRTAPRSIPALGLIVLGLFPGSEAFGAYRNRAADDTHLNTIAESLVHLVDDLPVQGDGATQGACIQAGGRYSMVKLRTNGVRTDDAFLVKEGVHLIITDLTWSAEPKTDESFTVGAAVRATLLIYQGSMPTVLRSIYVTPPVKIEDGDENSVVGGTQHFTAGIRVPEGYGVCVQVSEVTPNSTVLHNGREIDIQGYNADRNCGRRCREQTP